MDPPRRAVVLEDELVEVCLHLHPPEEHKGYLLAGGIAEGPILTGDGDVGGFALHVLGGFGSSNKSVELGAAVARGDLYGQAEVLAHGFETAHAEVLQSRDVALQLNVGDVVGFGRLRAQHLAQCKMLAQEHRWIEYGFHTLLEFVHHVNYNPWLSKKPHTSGRHLLLWRPSVIISDLFVYS